MSAAAATRAAQNAAIEARAIRLVKTICDNLRLLRRPLLRPIEASDEIVDWTARHPPVARPDHLRTIRGWRGVGLAPIVERDVPGLDDAPNLTAAINAQRDHFPCIRRP